MLNLSLFSGKKFGVLGLGKSGLATALALQKNGAHVIAWDDGQEGRKNAENQGVIIKPFDAIVLSTLDMLVVSPGVSLTYPKPHAVIALAKELNIPLTGDLDLFYKAHQHVNFIGITGTNGKSTTTSLLGHILKQAQREVTVGGNIGTPVLELDSISENGIGVLEVSSYQLDINPQLKFKVAILLNITPDHLDRHGNFENYVQTKKKIFQHQMSDDFAVIGIDSPSCNVIARELEEKNKQKIIKIAIERVIPGAYYTQNGVLFDGTSKQIRTILDLKDLPRLKGQHNWQNAAAAYIACHVLGISDAQIIDGLRTFPGLVHRQEYVASTNNIQFINDSKATNGEAAAKALVCFDNIYWILGGLPKQDGLTATIPYFSKIKHAFLIGKAAPEFAEELKGRVPYTHCEILEKAVLAAYEQAKRDQLPNATILLSPACASWDQYSSFEVRGDAFKKNVYDLSK
ncbi:MAG: UDP-N-acetylmuramoyl-L-alanine--D-glutamate ligase [Alphaproteobacteria bacterium]|nr:UDP-N-acetylmuramoyl-L-alanine--D-glutamate ligase [Alphaproteobacteria bacterium]